MSPEGQAALKIQTAYGKSLANAFQEMYNNASTTSDGLLMSAGGMMVGGVKQIAGIRNAPSSIRRLNGPGPVNQKALPSPAATSQRRLITSHPEAHAFERHGGNVTDSQLMTRARTGIAPDGSSLVVNNKTVIPPYSTAFHSDELLITAEQAIRKGPLQSMIGANPQATVLRVNGYYVGADLGRGYARVGSSTYRPGMQGPLQRVEGITKATAVYKKNAATGVWETITIFPEP